MGVRQVRRTSDMAGRENVPFDLGDLRQGVAESAEGDWHRRIHDTQVAAADQLLVLHQAQFGFDPGGVAVHHERDRPGRSDHGGLRVPDATGLAAGHSAIPPRTRSDAHTLRHGRQACCLSHSRHSSVWVHEVHGRFDAVQRVAVPAQHAAHRIRVRLEAVKRSQTLSHVSRSGIRLAAHQRSQRCRERPCLRRVVGDAGCHQQRPQIRETKAELTEAPGRLADQLGRVVGVAHQHVLCDEGDPHCLTEALDVEVAAGVGSSAIPEEGQQVEAGQIAGGVVEVDVFAAGVACADRSVDRSRVPVVDRGRELHSGIGTFPSRLGDLTEEIPRTQDRSDLTACAGTQLPRAFCGDRPHELVRQPDRVVGVLVLHRERVGAVEIHVEACGGECSRLAFLSCFAPHECLDVRVVGVEQHHLGGAPGLAPAADRPCRGIGTAHEADRAARRPPARQRLTRRPQCRQVHTGSRAAFKDAALGHVPVQDGFHFVINGEDEARRRLLGHTLHADVEPHRAVEGHPLMCQQPRQLRLERRSFLR